MKRRYVVISLILVLLVGDLWGLIVVFALPAYEPAVSQAVSSPSDATGTPSPVPTITPAPATSSAPPPTQTPSPTPTLSPTPTRALVVASTPTPSLVPPSRPLPALYVDGAYLKRSDTHQPVWLKGLDVEEFRQGTHHTLRDLYAAQGLGTITVQKWGVNLLRITVDPELVQATSSQIDKAIAFAEENGMYVILVPAASAVNPIRSEQRMKVPDDLVTSAMGYLAGRFKDRTNVLYEIWNEPHPDSIPSAGYDGQWQIWMQAGIKVAQAIRSRNPQVILVVPGGTKWARDLTYYKDHPFPFAGVVYDVHDYAAAPDYGYSREMWTWAIGKYPIMIGEFGGNPINPADPGSIPYMEETIQIVNQNPGLVHYAMYVLSDDGAWGIFTPRLQRMPKGNLLLDDVRRYAPTRFP